MPLLLPDRSHCQVHLNLALIKQSVSLKGGYYHVESRKSRVVGARCAHVGRAGGRPGRHRPQRGAAHAGHRAARFGVGLPVVLLRVPVGPRGDDAAGGTARRPLRSQEGDARRPDPVRSGLSGLRLCSVGRRVHRGAGGPRDRRGGRDRDGSVGADGVVHQAGAAAGGRHLGGRQLPGAAAWPDPWRLAAEALLVGLGVSAERPGRPRGAGRRLRTRPGGPIGGAGGSKITVAFGFALLAAGMLLGARTGVGSSGGFIAAWMALVGAGMGLAVATATSAVLSELSQERSGVGSAVMQALQKVGGPFGAAILGSVLLSTYQAQLHLAGLPAAVANVVKESLFGGLAVAQQLGSAPLLASVRTAFVQGMDVSLVVAAGIAVAGFVLTLAFLPGRAASKARGARPVEAAPARRPGAC